MEESEESSWNMELYSPVARHPTCFFQKTLFEVASLPFCTVVSTVGLPFWGLHYLDLYRDS